MNQIELHKKIDKILLKNPDEVKKEEVLSLILVNNDARQYFYHKADERWLDCFWDNGNGFLKVLKEKANNTPELNYLVKVAEGEPAKVVDIILQIPVSKEIFNPKVVDRFLLICSNLPAKDLSLVIPKIKDEKWIKLMDRFNSWGFGYDEMLKTLDDAGDYKNILILASAILEVRSKEDLDKIDSDNPFYFNNFSHIKVFKYLASVNKEHTEKALELATKKISKIILLWGKELDNSNIFSIGDKLCLDDVDFFELEPGKQARNSYRDDVRELASVVMFLTKRVFREKCDNNEEILEIYNEYIKTLPDSQSMWRLRLAVLSLYPKAFKKELKESFFNKLFKVERYHEIIRGTEYEKALQKGFFALTEDERREYIKKVIEYFVKKDKEKKDKKEDWHLNYGSEILSVIPDDKILEEYKEEIKEAGMEIKSDYEPIPDIGQMRGGIIKPRGPIEDFSRFSIKEIVDNLKTRWTPDKLRSQNTNDDFLRPVNAEGTGELLKKDIAIRFQDYINNAKLFFQRDKLDPHYTYSFFRGIHDVLREKTKDHSGINYEKLIDSCLLIKNSGEKDIFKIDKRERDTFDAWLTDWTDVHSAMVDVIQELLNENNGGIAIDFFENRKRIFEIMKYLLNYSDPVPADEVIESAKSKTQSAGSNDYLVSDPFSMAINSVRGRAFQVFMLFIYQDGKNFSKDEVIKIDAKSKELYEAVLEKEDTRALMFMFGYYFPSVYYRDKEWIKSLLPQVFSKEPEKKDLYTSAWEGYLSNNLYIEMFIDEDIQKLYERGINLTDQDYPKQEHFKDPDEGIATHFALAYMYYEDFSFKNKLFKEFWKNGNIKKHSHFVGFLGRLFISGKNEKLDEFLKKESRGKERLNYFWNWMLENPKDTEIFNEFGSWFNLDKGIFEPSVLAGYIKRTLEKTKGSMDWDYGLIKVIVSLADVAPKDTLSIARLYLLEGGVYSDKDRMPFRVEGKWFDALKILYKNQLTKEGTEKLIDDLIREGGRVFWKLKDVLNDS